MFLTGDIEREGSWWGASVEQLGAHAVATTRAGVKKALASTISEIAARYPALGGLTVEVADDGEHTLLVSSPEPARLTSLLIRCQRDDMAFSLAEVTKAIGAKSRNGWAQYERGLHEPSLGKLQSMLDAVASGLVVAVIPRTARVLPREDEEGTEELQRFMEDPSPANIAALRAKLTKRVVTTTRRGEVRVVSDRTRKRKTGS